MSQKVTVLPPLKRGHFAYGSNGFTIDDIPPVPPNRLRDLLFTDQIKDKRYQKQTRDEAYKLITKSWTKAQLRYYEIVFNSSEKVAELKERLMNSVQRGDCATVPVRVKLEEDSLRTEYDAKNGDHVQSQKDARRSEYGKLVLPAAKANYDIDLFLEEFFLRDQSRAILAMRLPGLENRSTVHAAAEKIPGLHTVSHGREPSRTLAIGWDKNAVFSATASESVEQDKKRLPQEDAGWQARMEKHRAIIGKSGNPRVGRHLRVHHAYGTFSVRCDDIAKQWPEGASNYVLRFVGGRFAIFNFGILEGVMRFGLDRASAICDDFDSEDDHRTTDSEGGETPLPKNSKSPGKNPKKRPLSTPSSVPASKRHKPPTSNPLRLYFQWRGRDTSEGMIQVDDDANPTHTGYIDMLDKRCVTFSGTANFGFAGNSVRFEGFKTQFLGGPMTMKWEHFSREAYERERANRWR